MQRKFLEELGLEKDMIDKIMDENGKDINREKEKAEAIKEQLETAKETLKGFEGVDVADLQGKITQLTADMEAKDTEYKATAVCIHVLSRHLSDSTYSFQSLLPIFRKKAFPFALQFMTFSKQPRINPY